MDQGPCKRREEASGARHTPAARGRGAGITRGRGIPGMPGPPPARRIPQEKSFHLSWLCFPHLQGRPLPWAAYLPSPAGVGRPSCADKAGLTASRGCTFHQPKAWRERMWSPLAAAEGWGFCGLHLPANPVWPRLRNLARISAGWCQCVWTPCPYSRVTG